MHRSVRRIAPDATWLAAAGYDGRVRIWAGATGRRKAVLAGHSSLVLTLAIAPDSTWLASAGYDGTVPIRGTTTWQVQALMRTDAEISTCAWLGSSALALAGKEAGLYLFSFTGT